MSNATLKDFYGRCKNPAAAREHSNACYSNRELASRVGTQAKSGKATAHMRDTGRRWLAWQVFRLK
jgi:hypothetical protein